MRRLERERKTRGLTQMALGRVLEIHPSWISNVEHGRWIPSPTSPAGKRLARFFGLSIDDLLKEVDEREPLAAR